MRLSALPRPRRPILTNGCARLSMGMPWLAVGYAQTQRLAGYAPQGLVPGQSRGRGFGGTGRTSPDIPPGAGALPQRQQPLAV
jgi:hypothetical protein